MNEEELRLECLRMAWSTYSGDKTIKMSEVLHLAEVLFQYVRIGKQ